MTSKRNETEYTPTPTEERLIETLLDPANRMKNVTEICNIVDCERVTYYRAFEKPGFVELYTMKSQELAKKYLGQVMSAFVREAVRGSYQHGKILLEMAGAYKEKSQLEHTGEIQVIFNIPRPPKVKPEDDLPEMEDAE
jgi:hypothetical protein